jgi:hypothetical protein
MASWDQVLLLQLLQSALSNRLSGFCPPALGGKYIRFKSEGLFSYAQSLVRLFNILRFLVKGLNQGLRWYQGEGSY